MAYTPFQDGTQAFGIPDSPVTIPTAGVTYIAEDINLSYGTQRPEIKDPNGVAIGQVLIPQVITGTMKLQLATAATVVPPRNAAFTMRGQAWLIETVGLAYTQGNYVYVNVTFVEKLN